MKFLKQACLKKVVFQRTLGSLMMASPNDYMYIIFPCLTTYLMQVPKMCFFVQQKKQSTKKHSAENIKQKKIIYVAENSKKAFLKKHTAKNIHHDCIQQRSIQQKSISPEKLISWITYLGRFA